MQRLPTMRYGNLSKLYFNVKTRKHESKASVGIFYYTSWWDSGWIEFKMGGIEKSLNKTWEEPSL